MKIPLRKRSLKKVYRIGQGYKEITGPLRSGSYPAYLIANNGSIGERYVLRRAKKIADYLVSDYDGKCEEVSNFSGWHENIKNTTFFALSALRKNGVKIPHEDLVEKLSEGIGGELSGMPMMRFWHIVNDVARDSDRDTIIGGWENIKLTGYIYEFLREKYNGTISLRVKSGNGNKYEAHYDLRSMREEGGKRLKDLYAFVRKDSLRDLRQFGVDFIRDQRLFKFVVEL